MKHYWLKFTGCVNTCAYCGIRYDEVKIPECLQSDIDAYRKRYKIEEDDEEVDMLEVPDSYEGLTSFNHR